MGTQGGAVFLPDGAELPQAAVPKGLGKGVIWCTGQGGLRRIEHGPTQLQAHERAADLAEEMLRAVRALALVHPDGPTGMVTISIGYALRSGHAESADMLLRRADQAMYRAKAEGRNCFRGD